MGKGHMQSFNLLRLLVWPCIGNKEQYRIRDDNLKRHRKVHLKYSNKTPQSTEDTCRDLVLEIADKVVATVEESSGTKRKHEVVEREAQITIDEEALKKSALKINKDLTVLLNILSKNFTK